MAITPLSYFTAITHIYPSKEAGILSGFLPSLFLFTTINGLHLLPSPLSISS